MASRGGIKPVPGKKTVICNRALRAKALRGPRVTWGSGKKNLREEQSPGRFITAQEPILLKEMEKSPEAGVHFGNIEGTPKEEKVNALKSGEYGGFVHWEGLSGRVMGGSLRKR